MLKAILFDLDDTLIDWSHFEANWEEISLNHLKGVYEYALTIGTPQWDFPTFHRNYNRNARHEWIAAGKSLISPHLGRAIRKTCVEMGIQDDSLDEAACLEAYGWGIITGTYVFPDVVDVLQHLTDKGIELGIITNAFAPMYLRDRELKEHGLLDYFPTCRFSAADVGYLKPHPEIFKAALNCLDLQPDEVVFIGDNPTADVAGAQVAGMKAILRVKQPRVPMISGLVIPDAAINTFHELLPILDTWYPGWDQ